MRFTTLFLSIFTLGLVLLPYTNFDRFTLSSIIALGSTHPTLYCKCVLEQDFSIITLKPEQTCSDCSASLCLEDPHFKKPEEKKSKMTFSCFQRESLKDQLMIYLFLILTAALLIGVFLKPQYQRLRA